MNARHPCGVGSHIFGEHAETAACQIDGAVGMPTRSSPRYLAESPLKTCKKSRVTIPASQPGHIVGDRWKPKDAWPALASTLAGQIPDDPR